MNVLVTRWVWIRWSARSGSNRRMTTTVPPMTAEKRAKEPGAE
jgi:hypothetical protein